MATKFRDKFELEISFAGGAARLYLDPGFVPNAVSVATSFGEPLSDVLQGDTLRQVVLPQSIDCRTHWIRQN